MFGLRSFLVVGRTVRVLLERRRCAGEPKLTFLGVFLRFNNPSIGSDPSLLDLSMSFLACLTAFSTNPLDCG